MMLLTRREFVERLSARALVRVDTTTGAAVDFEDVVVAEASSFFCLMAGTSATL